MGPGLTNWICGALEQGGGARLCLDVIYQFVDSSREALPPLRSGGGGGVGWEEVAGAEDREGGGTGDGI